MDAHRAQRRRDARLARDRVAVLLRLGERVVPRRRRLRRLQVVRRCSACDDRAGDSTATAQSANARPTATRFRNVTPFIGSLRSSVGPCFRRAGEIPGLVPRMARRHDCSALIGRDLEQRRIDDLLADARAGSSGALVFVGEPGIGKTALLDYAAAAATDFEVVRGGQHLSAQEKVVLIGMPRDVSIHGGSFQRMTCSPRVSIGPATSTCGTWKNSNGDSPRSFTSRR
jgi:hypothetical protein